MDWNLKKMWPAMAASLVAFTTVVNADYTQNQNNQQNQNNNNGNTNQQPMVRNGEGPDMMITPNANISNRLYLTGEALFWWAREGGLEFAINDPCYDEVNSIFHGARVQNPKTKWSTGFRVGLGYVFKHDGWDLGATWTYFQSHNKTACGPSSCDCDCSSVCCNCSFSGGCCRDCFSSSSNSSCCNNDCDSFCSEIPSSSFSSCPPSSSGCCFFSSSSSSECCNSSSSSSDCCFSSSSSSDCCFSSSSSNCCSSSSSNCCSSSSSSCCSSSCDCCSSSSDCCSSSSSCCSDSCGFSCCSSPWCGPTIPLWSDLPTDGTNLTVGNAAAKWKVRLNVVDLDLGRAFMTSKYLALRPTIGVRGAWTNEKYKIHYGDFNNVQQPIDATVNVFDQNIELTNRTWGVGPKFGIDSRWTMGWGISFYGNAAISLLYGNFSIHQRNIASYDIFFDEEFGFCNETCTKIGETYHVGQAVTDLALGLMWEHNFASDWTLAINLGWEQHMFFNRNQYWRITRPGGPDGFTADFAHERGDLSFQGISLGGSIGF